MIGKYLQKTKIISQSESNKKSVFNFLTYHFKFKPPKTGKKTFRYKSNKIYVEVVC